MKQFIDVHDAILNGGVNQLIQLAARMKADPFDFQTLGRQKTLGLFFFNASLRTRLSTQLAAENLGMRVMVVNLNQEGWALEFQDGVVMDGTKPEHIREAAAVVGEYCDIIGVRTFPELKSKAEDYCERVINGFIQYSGKPVISLESATGHPLQALADSLTIQERWHAHPDFGKRKPKVVLSWAPHPRAIPHCVANSFAQWMQHQVVDLLITHPEGYDLASEVVGDYKPYYTQDEALKDADFVYAKNWSSVTDYGQILSKDPSWTINQAKLSLTNGAKFMHCLPTRRNVEVADDVLDSDTSIVIQQAANRVPACQAVLYKMLTA